MKLSIVAHEHACGHRLIPERRAWNRAFGGGRRLRLHGGMETEGKESSKEGKEGKEDATFTVVDGDKGFISLLHHDGGTRVFEERRVRSNTVRVAVTRS